ncbi:hypothetical protein [Paenibacillus sp. GCM10023250]|uniref:hypothetical protein n=1 Tax=Paenibacillus sp. GCM10023250 TaxID=3252648 RepID=UPI00360F6B40
MDTYEIIWTREQLWKGCILASIAHAIMVAHYPEISHEHSWDGINYSVQDSAGTRGTITFHTQYCVAAFRDERSSRISSGDAGKYFLSAPSNIVELAEEEALQYLLDDINGQSTPLITTAFWSDGEKLYSHDSFPEMLRNGGDILEIQVMDIDSAIKSWVDYYDMNVEQVKLLRSIYEKKISNPNQEMKLSEVEVALISSDDQEGLGESKISFEEMGILLEV